MRLPGAHVFGRRRPSRIGTRLFAFNLLVVFVPVAGILYLDVYEAQLLEAQERGMVQQARIAAAALGSAQTFDAEHVQALLASTGEHADARIKVFDANGHVIGDSARYWPRAQPRISDEYSGIDDPRERWLYRLGAAVVHVRDRIGALARRVLTRARTLPAESSSDIPREVRTALTGKYGAATRQTPGQRSLTLSSAVPVRRNEQIAGAVVVSQSTYRILQALYRVRLRLFEIVLLSLASAAVLTWLASSTIVNPIVRLRYMAAALTSRRGELAGVFGRIDRKDEIGDLARSLEELAARLDAHIKLLESFAADVSHEFRNPLAAIRTATETVASADSPDDRERFRSMLLRDVDRLEGLVAGVRELARIDTEVSSELRTPVEIGGLLRAVVDGRQRVNGVAIRLRPSPTPIRVNASPERLMQVFENLIDNATSLSSHEPVEIAVAERKGRCDVSVSDRGPGIPDAHLDRVFDRFFSYRPTGDRREHMGLGLAIAKAIVTGYGGSITAQNRTGGGAQFRVELPTTSD
jgi:two-component system sensor histidine kinase ChvG